MGVVYPPSNWDITAGGGSRPRVGERVVGIISEGEGEGQTEDEGMMGRVSTQQEINVAAGSWIGVGRRV